MIWRFKFKFYQNINELRYSYQSLCLLSYSLSQVEFRWELESPYKNLKYFDLFCWASHFSDIYITFVNEGELKVNLTCLNFFVWKSSVLTRSSCFTSQQFAISNLNYLDLQRNFSQPLIQLKFITNWNHMQWIAEFLLMKNCTI